MISPFEATLLGVLAESPASRYDVMKKIQSQSLYWAGSPGAVYSALDRLLQKGLLAVIEDTEPPLYKVTDLGFEKGFKFLKTPVPAQNLVLKPFLIRLKLRGLQEFSSQDRVTYYRAQLKEYSKAKRLVKDKETGFSGKSLQKGLSDLAIAQLSLEEVFIQRCLAEELAAKNEAAPNAL